MFLVFNLSHEGVRNMKSAVSVPSELFSILGLGSSCGWSSAMSLGAISNRRLLPYHDVAVKRGVDDNPAMEIAPEISAIRRERFMRFILSTGSRDLYIDTTSIAL